MANTPYENYVLENRFEDQYNSYLNLMQFCNIDDSLELNDGMKKTFRIYKATNNKTQVLAQGEGNTETIEVDFYNKTYNIELLQNRFIYFDEEAMKDPLVVDKGLDHQAVDMYNVTNAKIMNAFLTANYTKDDDGTTIAVPTTSPTTFDFGAFADAVAQLKDIKIRETDQISGLGIFGLVAPEDVPAIRKNLGQELKYVVEYVRQGYIGTVCGVNLYITDEQTSGKIVIATRDAVTYFIKKGTQVEQERDANTRKNTAYLRKYGIPALTDVNKICVMTLTA